MFGDPKGSSWIPAGRRASMCKAWQHDSTFVFMPLSCIKAIKYLSRAVFCTYLHGVIVSWIRGDPTGVLWLYSSTLRGERMYQQSRRESVILINRNTMTVMNHVTGVAPTPLLLFSSSTPSDNLLIHTVSIFPLSPALVYVNYRRKVPRPAD